MTQRNSFLFTDIKTSCNGCRACEYICPHQAIQMIEDAEGFLYLNRDLSKCTECGLCDIKCPMNARIETKKETFTPRYFAIWPKQEDFQLTQDCATMGLSTMIAQYVLRQGGVVYGVVLDNDKQRAVHVRILTEEEQVPMRNSKYLQSDVNNTYVQVKEDLLQGKFVYYTGTPCQIAGLKQYLKRDYDALITMDVVCHGVFSYKLYQEELKYWQHKYQGKILNLRLRGKGRFPYSIGGLVNFDVEKKGKTKHVDVPAKFSPVYHCYAYSEDGVNYIHRPSCYDCKFRSIERVGDLTIGDFHGRRQYHADKIVFEMEKYGVSAVIVSSQNGMNLLEKILSRVNYFETDKQAICVQPALIGTKRELPQKRADIYDNIGKVPFEDIVNKYIFSEDYASKCEKWVQHYLWKTNFSLFLLAHPALLSILRHIKHTLHKHD